ncbi:MAG: glycoside hydrolase family 130 protein [Planctomycetota bacterium]|nr:glycoside hydrolase family 130 protein [Planctomycetota bacterium]
MPDPVIRRHPQNPVLASGDVPFPSTQIFNAGVARFRGEYVMVFRADRFDREKRCEAGTALGIAFSSDGVKWQVRAEPLKVLPTGGEIRRAYDPRLTVLDDHLYLCFAVDTAHGIRGGVAVTDDLQRFEVLGLSAPDNRNMVLFPERIKGKLARLERPFPVYGSAGRGPERFDIWYSESVDGRHWGNTQLVLGSEQVSYCNNKIGPGTPPLRTPHGWLALFHYVYKDDARVLKGWEPYPWTKLYGAGVMLLDLQEPWRVIGLSREPVLVPETSYELDGFRGSVIFPGGLLAEQDGTVKTYYGAADTVECLATARLDDLLALAQPVVPQ